MNPQEAEELLAETTKNVGEVNSKGGLGFGAVAVVALAIGAGFYFTKMN